MVLSIFNIIFVLVFDTSLNSRDYKIKLKTTLYTAVSIDIDAYSIIGIHKMLRRFFHGVKYLRYQDLNKCQIPAHPGLNSCQMPGGCPGGGGGGGGGGRGDGHSWIWLIHKLWVLINPWPLWCQGRCSNHWAMKLFMVGRSVVSCNKPMLMLEVWLMIYETLRPYLQLL